VDDAVGAGYTYAFFKTSRSPLGPIHLGYGVLLRSVHRPEREADHSLSRLRMSGAIPLLPPPAWRVKPTLLLRFARGTKILGTRSPSRLNFVRRSLNTGGSSAWKLHHVTILEPIIYETVSRFVTNCGPLHLTIIGHLTRYAAARLRSSVRIEGSTGSSNR